MKRKSASLQIVLPIARRAEVLARMRKLFAPHSYSAVARMLLLDALDLAEASPAARKAVADRLAAEAYRE